MTFLSKVSHFFCDLFLSLQLKGEETLKTVVSVGLCVETFNIVSDDYGQVQFFHFQPGISILTIFGSKISELSVSAGIWYLD